MNKEQEEKWKKKMEEEMMGRMFYMSGLCVSAVGFLSIVALVPMAILSLLSF